MALGGVYAVNVTPFRNDSSFQVDVDSYLEHVRWLGESGVQGVVPFGTNGEGPSVALHEKVRVLEALFDERPAVQVVPNVAEGNLPETVEYLRVIADFPAQAVMVLPPYYFKPVSAEGLMRFYDVVMANTRHPVVLYHIPKYAVPIPQEVVTALPVWGVKDSGGEPGYAEGVLAEGKGVLLGTEDDLWRRLNLGVSGLVSALANFVPDLLVEMLQKVQEGDENGGRELSEQIGRVRARTKEYTSIALLKRLAEARHGVPMGTVRPPLVPAPANYDTKSVLRIAGVF